MFLYGVQPWSALSIGRGIQSHMNIVVIPAGEYQDTLPLVRWRSSATHPVSDGWLMVFIRGG
jgi:hypothetical protein